MNARMSTGCLLVALAAIGWGASCGQDEDSACAQLPSEPAPLRRLTRVEYRNAVFDLTRIEVDLDALTPDEKVGAFDSNAIASASELVVEQYMRVAERVAQEVAADPGDIVPCPIGQGACVEQLIRDFGRRAYRRPLTEVELERMRGVFDVGYGSGGEAAGVRLLLQTFLQSPNFLYHVELGIPETRRGGRVELTPYELAARLSFFLWGTAPDDELLDLAAEDGLSTMEQIRAQAERMLADPRARGAVEGFFSQWLALDEIDALEKDPAAHPEFTRELRAAMRDDTMAFVDYVFFDGNARVETFLTAPYAFPDPVLWATYGLESGGTGRGGSSMPPAGQRAGLLTQPAFLAVHANADQTSPVRRGKWVRERLLCHDLPPPPPGVDTTVPAPNDTQTTRERFEQHTADPACASCHRLVDDLGFAFEHYDGVGAYRTLEGAQPVDASGALSDTDVDASFGDATELMQILVESDQVHDCIARQWLRYGLGRMESEADRCAVDDAASGLARTHGDMRALVLDLVTSPGFRQRSVEQEVDE